MAGDNIWFEAPELDAWEASLGRVGPRIMHFLPKAIEVTLRHVQDDARKSVRTALGHIPHIPESITYDVALRTDGVYGEVGYDRNKPQGNLGHIIEYGRASYDAPNAPQRNVAKAGEKNYEDFISGIRKAAIDALGS